MGEGVAVRADQVRQLGGVARLGCGRRGAQPADLWPAGDFEAAELGLGEPLGIGGVAQAGEVDTRRLGGVG